MKKFFIILNIAALFAYSFSAFGADQANSQRHTDSQAKEREYVPGGGMALGVTAASNNRFNAQSTEVSQSVERAGSTSINNNNGKVASARATNSRSGKQPLRFNPAPE